MPPRLAIVLKGYPRLSETFVAQEILALEQRGSGFGGTDDTCEDVTCLAPWTEALFDAFAETHGVRVEDHLPNLFLRENGRALTPLKAQYAETMLALFLENFAQPCLDWCEANGLALTGHVLHENSLSCQVSTHGSVQRSYPLMHVPGIDYLGEHGRDYWVAKQVDSTARQFEQPWILSELYGCTGWQMNFESHKAVGAWQALFGVNLRCHHLSWYTMGGEAKRDYPASILHQSPWHTEYNTVETWFARLGYFRAQGEPCCDLLVINPVESVWGKVYPGAINGMNARDTGIRALETHYAELFHILAGKQIDFDYGDEALLAEHGAIAEERLGLGAMRYTTVLVSGADTLRSTTVDLLTAFVSAGGRVIFAGEPPAHVDSQASTGAADLAATAFSCAFDETAIVEALDGHTPQRVRITETESGEAARDVFCQLRAGAEAHYLTVLNVNRDRAFDVTIELFGVEGAAVEEWDLETGERAFVHAAMNETIAFETRLHTSQARCFRLPSQRGRRRQTVDSQDGSAAPGAEIHRLATAATAVEDSVILDEPTAYRLAEKNICVLDLPTWSIDDGGEQPVDDILRIDRAVRQHFGLAPRAGDMVQPWFRGSEASPVLGQVTLRYPLVLAPGALAKSGDLSLILETPERFTVTINGSVVDTAVNTEWWVDIALRRLALPAGLLHEGANEIVVSATFSEDLNLEAMYLLGDFAVTMQGCTPQLGPMPVTVTPGDLVEQGFPFYSDSFIYTYTVPAALVGQTARVRIPEYEGAFLKLRSGEESAMIPWRPNEACLTLGERLEVEICITRKNTFGPLHLKDPRPSAVGPGHFVPGAEQFSLEPVFIPSGLLRPVELEGLSDG